MFENLATNFYFSGNEYTDRGDEGASTPLKVRKPAPVEKLPPTLLHHFSIFSVTVEVLMPRELQHDKIIQSNLKIISAGTLTETDMRDYKSLFPAFVLQICRVPVHK